MKDEYNRRLECPKCNRRKITFVIDAKGKPTYLYYCKFCGFIGTLTMFRAIPITENPSRRDSEIEDPNEERTIGATVEGIASSSDHRAHNHTDISNSNFKMREAKE